MSLPQPSKSFAWTQEPWGPALRCRPLLAAAPHLFTSAAVSVSRDAGDPGLAAAASSLGLAPEAVTQVHQVHGCEVVVCRKGDRSPFRAAEPEDREAAALSADALVSDDPERAVGVRAADCVPILMASRSGRVVAAVHAGWRGTASGVVRYAVQALRERFGVPAGDLLAALGPSIRVCCYEVGPEVRVTFREAGHGNRALASWFAPGTGNRLYLDVLRANRDQLEALGIPPSQIFDSGLCTVHNDGVFHSYRRAGSRAGRGLAIIRVG